MLFNILANAAPSPYTAESMPKGVRLKVGVADTARLDPNFVEYVHVRYPTALDAANDTNGTEVDRNAALRGFDNEQLTRGVAYWWRCYWIDEMGNPSALSATVTLTYRGATTDDIDDDAVTDRKQKRRDPASMVRNPNCDDIALWAGSTALTSIADGLDTESTHRLEIAASAATVNISTLTDIPVKGGKKYLIGATFYSPDGILISQQAQVNWYSDIAGTVFITNVGIGSINNSGITEFTGILTAPANARRGRLLLYKNAGTSSKHSITGPVFRRATDEEILADDSVATKKIKKRAVKASKVAVADAENMIPDGDFDQSEWTDIWDVTGGTIPLNFWLWAGSSLSGSQQLVLDNLVTGGASGGTIPQLAIQSEDYMPVKGGQTLAWEITISTTDTVSAVGHYYRILWFDKNKVALGSPFTEAIGNGPVPITQTTYTGFVAVPAGARYCQVRVILNSNATTRYLVIDSITLRKAKGAELTTAGSMTDVKTDPTPPGTVAAPTLATTIPSDIDGDGKIDSVLVGSITAPAGVPVKSYEVECWWSDTVAGTYAYRKTLNVPAAEPFTAGTVTTFAFKANQKRFWKIKAKAITFNGKKSAAFGALTTTGLQPPLYTAAVVQAATGLTVTPVDNGFSLFFDKCTDLNYKETIVFVAGVEIYRFKGNSWTDKTPRTPDASYTYSVQHVDSQGRVGTVSSGVAASYRQLQTAEVAPRAIYPSKLYRPLTSNLVRDYDLIEKENLLFTQFLTSAGTGTEVPMLDANVVQMSNPSTDAIGPSNYKFRLTAPAVSYTLRVETDRLSPVEEDLWYEFSCYLSPKVSWATIQQITMRAMWWTIDSAGDIVALSENASTWNTPATLPPATPLFQKRFKAPSNAVYASLKMSIQAATGQLVEHDFTSPKIRQLPQDPASEMIKAYDAGAFTFGNTAGSVVQSITGAFPSSDTRPVKSIEAVARFRNGSGAAGDYSSIDVQYSIKGSGIWNSLGDVYSNVPVGNGGHFTGMWEHVPISGALYDAIDTVDFRLLVDPDQAANDLRQRLLSIRVFYQ